MAIVGTLQHVDVPSLLELARQLPSAALLLHTPEHQATIFVQHNEVVHAVEGHRTGLSVLHELLAVKQGVFVLNERVTAPERTINMPWNALLVEGLQQLDEQTFEEETADSANDLLSAVPLGDMAISYVDGNLRLSGAIGSNGVESLIEMGLQMDKPTRLTVTSRGGNYEAFMMAQKVVHAANGQERGVAALAHLLASRSGTFALDEGVFPQEVTISQPWESLRVEARTQQAEEDAKHFAPLLAQLAGQLQPHLKDVGVIEENGRLLVSHAEMLPTMNEQAAMLFQTVPFVFPNPTETVSQRLTIQTENETFLGLLLEPRRAYLIAIVQNNAPLDHIVSTVSSFLPQFVSSTQAV